MEIALLEKEPILGGQISTLHHDDFLIEEGPESFVRYKKGGLELCEALGLQNELIVPHPKNRSTFILKNGKLVHFPRGVMNPFSQSIFSLISTFLFTPLLSSKGKLRLALEPWIPPRNSGSDETIEAFANRRLGAEFCQNLLLPLLSGVYGPEAGSLSVRALLKEYASAEQTSGSIFRALRKKQSTEKTPLHSTKSIETSVFISLHGGLAKLVQALQDSLTECHIVVNTRVRSIEKNSSGYGIFTQAGEKLMEADALLMATPAYMTASLVRPIDPELAHRLDSIPYGSGLVFTFGFYDNQVKRPLRGTGFLVPKKEKLPFHACTWSSSKWTDRAPKGKVLIRTYVSISEQFTDFEQLRNSVLDALRHILKISGEPILSETHPHFRSLPQYPLNYEDTLASIRQSLTKHRGLFLAGAAYGGVGIPDCILSADNAGGELLAYLEKGFVPGGEKKFH